MIAGSRIRFGRTEKEKGYVLLSFMDRMVPFFEAVFLVISLLTCCLVGSGSWRNGACYQSRTAHRPKYVVSDDTRFRMQIFFDMVFAIISSAVRVYTYTWVRKE